MASPDGTAEAREELLSAWLEGVDNPRVVRFVREEMGRYDLEMFRRAAREILASYEHSGAPLRLLQRLRRETTALHVFAQPREDEYVHAQREFAREHPWFAFEHVDARTHLLLETPSAVATRIEEFLAS
jgi:hypothetical protein